MYSMLQAQISQMVRNQRQLIDETIEAHLVDILAERFPDGVISNSEFERRCYMQTQKEEYLIDGEIVLTAEWTHDGLAISLPTGDTDRE